MIIHFTHRDSKYSADLSNGLDISIPLKSGAPGPKCFYAPDFKVEPVIAGDFIGSIEQGSPVNFKNILVNLIIKRLKMELDCGKFVQRILENR